MPIAAEKIRTLIPLRGLKMKIAITAALLAYIPASNFGFEYICPDQPDRKDPAILKRPIKDKIAAAVQSSNPLSITYFGT